MTFRFETMKELEELKKSRSETFVGNRNWVCFNCEYSRCLCMMTFRKNKKKPKVK